MIGIFYSQQPVRGPSFPCPSCRGQMSTSRIHRTGHLCGIPLLPLESKNQAVCWNCGYQVPICRHRFFPGRRDPLGWQMGHRPRGRNLDWDRRDSYTSYFGPWRRMRRYRY